MVVNVKCRKKESKKLAKTDSFLKCVPEEKLNTNLLGIYIFLALWKISTISCGKATELTWRDICYELEKGQ